MQAINPSTEENLEKYEELSDELLEKKLEESHHAYLNWRITSFEYRAALLKKVAHLLREKKEHLADLMAKEMGKPIKNGIGEAEKCAWACEYYAENAAKFLQQEELKSDAQKSFVTYQPLGCVLAIMPWNFPFWQVFRFAAPSLMAGNVGLLKHAPNVPACAEAIEEIFLEAGCPKGVFSNLFISLDQTSKVIEDNRVKAVTLTGSTRAGKAVAAKAGSVLKKTVLELGGSDPYLVLEDADLEEAIQTCVASRLINNGQSCISAKRFIVPASLQEKFEQGVVNAMKEKVFGDPFDEKTDLGPMARGDLRNELHKQVEASIDAGATCLLGGKLPEGKGYFYPPTVLTNIKKGMPAYDEELFGPVASILIAKDEEEAIQLANDTVYGLGAAVFTRNIERGEQIAAEKLEAGCCFVNSFVKSDPRLPFGGIKESGYGRELSLQGIHEFVNIKTVYVK